MFIQKYVETYVENYVIKIMLIIVFTMFVQERSHRSVLLILVL